MNRYRITYVNTAFSPRASYFTVEAYDNPDAVRRFREQVNQACGDNGIVRVEQLEGGVR